MTASTKALGACPTTIGVSGTLSEMRIGANRLGLPVTNSVLPFGVMPRVNGPTGTAIGAPGVFVATWMGRTVLLPVQTTYTVLPFGVTAISKGETPTGMGGSAFWVATSMGVTVPSPLFET